MVAALRLLLQTDRSPLEAGVNLEYTSYAEYIVPENSLLAPLLTQLEGVQGLWETFRRYKNLQLSPTVRVYSFCPAVRCICLLPRTCHCCLTFIQAFRFRCVTCIKVGVFCSGCQVCLRSSRFFPFGLFAHALLQRRVIHHSISRCSTAKTEP